MLSKLLQKPGAQISNWFKNERARQKFAKKSPQLISPERNAEIQNSTRKNKSTRKSAERPVEGDIISSKELCRPWVKIDAGELLALPSPTSNLRQESPLTLIGSTVNSCR